MPTVNIYYRDETQSIRVKEITPDLKEFVAKELTCGEITLKSDEVSVRLVKVEGNGMIGEVEAEVSAFAFDERIKK